MLDMEGAKNKLNGVGYGDAGIIQEALLKRRVLSWFWKLVQDLLHGSRCIWGLVSRSLLRNKGIYYLLT